MSQTHGLFLMALLALSVIGALVLATSRPAGIAGRRALLVVALLAALLPFGIHAQQTYESLVKVAPATPVPLGQYPGMDRFAGAVWLTIAILLALGAVLAWRRPALTAALPAVMALLYFAWLLPMAAAANPVGAGATAIPRYAMIIATVVGIALLLAGARRLPPSSRAP